MTETLLRLVDRPRFQVRLEWEPRDLWLGVFWKTRRYHGAKILDVYLCAVPCLPLVVSVVTEPAHPAMAHPFQWEPGKTLQIYAVVKEDRSIQGPGVTMLVTESTLDCRTGEVLRLTLETGDRLRNRRSSAR